MVAALEAHDRVGRSGPLGAAVGDVSGLIAGRYRLMARLGSGAMGVVWQAHDEVLHRIVAVKQLLVPAGVNDPAGDEVLSLVLREGRITARLQHPHVIAVYDVVVHDGYPCLIMEYLPSRSLATVLSAHGVLVHQAVASIGYQISSGLAAAHEAGIVHRDIKPGNVLLADDGTAKITDFGVSQAVGDLAVTDPGMVVGTPAYLAPELARGHSADFAADVFALGATLYTALEGTPPFGIDHNALVVLDRVASGEIIPPRRCGALTPLLLHLLERHPHHRPTMRQAHAVLAMLDDGLAGSHGDLFACTLPLSGLDPPVPPPLPSLGHCVASVAQQQTQTPSTVDSFPVDALAGQPSAEDADRDPPVPPPLPSLGNCMASVVLEQTPPPAGSPPGDAAAGQPSANDDGVGWSEVQLMLIGAVTVIVLAASVLLTLFVGRGSVPSSPAAGLPRISGVSAPHLQAFPTQPGLGDPTPEDTATRSGLLG